MTPTLTTAIRDLTQPWQEILTPDNDRDGYQVIDHKPRIEMLRDAISSSMGGTTAGGRNPAATNLLDLTALELLQKIDEQTRATMETLTTERPSKDLATALEQYATIADTLRVTNNITERDHTRLVERAQQWREGIDNLFDPPRQKELKAPCPKCGTEHTIVDGNRKRTLVAYYWEGHQPAARCLSCGETWMGERELLQLGFQINAAVDSDALRDMGVAV